MISRHLRTVAINLVAGAWSTLGRIFCFFCEVLMSCNERQSLPSFMWSQRRGSCLDVLSNKKTEMLALWPIRGSCMTRLWMRCINVLCVSFEVISWSLCCPKVVSDSINNVKYRDYLCCLSLWTSLKSSCQLSVNNFWDLFFFNRWSFLWKCDFVIHKVLQNASCKTL